MIFKCAWCKELMPFLNTPGDEINDSLICPECCKHIKEILKKAKKLKVSLINFIANPN